MKMILVALSMVIGASAHAFSVPAYKFEGCRLSAQVVETVAASEYLVARSETLVAPGVISCSDSFGNKSAPLNVIVTIKSFGVGIAKNGPATGLKVAAVFQGINTPYAAIGSFNFTAGPRLGLLNSRYSVLSSVSSKGFGSVGISSEISLEDRYSIGADASWSTVTIAEAVKPPVKTRY